MGVESGLNHRRQLGYRVHRESSGALGRHLRVLEVEHRDLDEIVQRLSTQTDVDELLIKRLKRRKLLLKDQIARIRSALIPNLDA